jgi:hypothetical protein
MEPDLENFMNPAAHLEFFADRCRPIQNAERDHDTGARIGGKAPHGVEPKDIREGETKYWLTIPWLHDSELSLFLWLSPIASESNCTWTNSRKVHTSASSLAQAVVHPAASRSGNGLLASSLASRGLEIGPSIEDVSPYDPDMPWPEHKLGGKPFFDDAGSYAYQLTNNLISAGYIHVLQMTFPSNSDAGINGSWPLGEMIFHFVRFK